METKTCTKCKTEKSLTEFSKKKSQKDGLNYCCKSCEKKYQASWYEKTKANFHSIDEGLLPEKKFCSCCKKEKPIQEFYTNKFTKNVVQNKCKACEKEYQANWYKKNQANFHLIKNSFPETKTCTKCNTEKPRNQFYTNKSAKDGKQNICKACCGELYKNIKRNS